MCATGISEECEGNIDACQGKFKIFEVLLELPSERWAKLNLAKKRLHVEYGRSNQTSHSCASTSHITSLFFAKLTLVQPSERPLLSLNYIYNNLGDSGGPLICKASSDHRHYITGVVSTGTKCGAVKFPGIYVPVQKYWYWLLGIVDNREPVQYEPSIYA